MSGAFLGISVARSRRISRRTRRSLLDIDSVIGGPGRRVWGDVRRGRSALITWERESSLGTTVRHGVDEARMVCGVPAELGARLDAEKVPVGIYSEITADTTGAITAACDDLGYGSIFHWESSGVAAVSSRPELLVDVASILGDAPAKDASIASELAHIGFLGPTRTGWAEISTLRAGMKIRLVDGMTQLELDARVADWAHEPRDDMSLDDHVGRAAESLRTDVRRVLDLGLTVVADLTAGRDSKIVLAALLSLESEQSVPLQTIGTVELADVRVAAAIAAHFGIEHRHGYLYPLPRGDFAHRFHRHVAATAGVANVLDGMRESLEPIEHLRLSGLIGEIPRGWRTRVSREDLARSAPGRLTRVFGAGRLEILRPPAREEARASIRAELLDTGHGDLPAWHAVHRYYSEVRLRGRMSRVDDFTPEVRVYPLYTPELLSLGVRAMWHHPDADVGALLTERLVPGLDSLDLDAPPTSTNVGTADPPPKEPSLMRAALHDQARIRREFFASLAELDSEAWERIDRAAFVAAVDDYDSLTHPQIRLLHGAASAIIWLVS